MQKIDLQGTWTLRQANGKLVVHAQVPGDTHSALLAAGKIADPYLAANELDVQWLNREDWVYARAFHVDDAMLSKPSVILNCDSLDTIAQVRINGQLAGTSDNMFARCRFEVKKLLRSGENTIEILLKSAENAAVAAARKLPYEIPCGHHPVQSPHRNLVRKVQCHSGWDWGCCLMVAGVYGDIYLGGVEHGRIEYVYTAQRHRKGACVVDVTTEVVSPMGGRTELEIVLGHQATRQPVTLKAGLNVLTARVTVKNPRLWWPSGLGEQHLYPLTVRVAGDEVGKRLGLRALELVNKPDRIGRSMFFRVNGVDVFCKGANWIPCDALPQRQTRAAYDELLSSAAAAHMNMLRVWGGGQYERDDFYELCDEKGLLVWQDMMFACALYPATPDFLESVRREVAHQVKRLRDHACLALWCGNNENVGALGWFGKTGPTRDRAVVDYDRLNEQTIGRTVRECDPTRAWWPSSPCGGPDDYGDCWHDDARGDMHYWSVWHEGKSFDAYHAVTPRFCSEFGYQSFPSVELARGYCPPGQMNVTSPVMEHHQRHGRGNALIVEMFTRYFRMPEGFENFVYLSQVQQALAIKTAVEHWRHLRPTCMGTLYWQLNDNWPVCSWSSLEYGGKWKLLHHAARRFYAPTIVSTFQRADRTVEVWLTSDTLQAQKAAVTVEVYTFAGKRLRRDTLAAQTPAGGGAKLLRAYAPEELPADAAAGFMLLRVAGVSPARRGKEVPGTFSRSDRVFRNEHFFCEPKRCDLPAATVQATAGQSGDALTVTLTTDAPAFWVTVEAEGIRGEFDDNGFTLLPGEKRTLVFAPKQAVRPRDFARALRVRHLRATYG